MNLRRLVPNPARGMVAALLVLVASFATSIASAGASPVRQEDPAVHSTLALHSPAAHRVADEQRTQRRVPPAADLPFAGDAPRALDAHRASARPAGVERNVVVRAVPRVYDATAPPKS